MYYCTWGDCEAEVDTNSGRVTHRRLHNEQCKGVAGAPNGVVTRVDGKFCCPRCPLRTIYATSLLRHAVKCKGPRPISRFARPGPAPRPNAAPVPPPAVLNHDAVIDDDATLISNDFLDEMRLSAVLINDMTLLVCVVCSKVLIPNVKAICSHAQKSHGIRAHGKTFELRVQALEAALDSANLRLTPADVLQASKYITVGPELLPAVPCINAFPGFRCTRCAYYCKKFRAIDHHRLQKHPFSGDARDTAGKAKWREDSIKDCLVQQLRQAILKGNVFYGVLSRPSDSIEDPVSSAWDAYEDADDQSGSNATSSVKAVSQWLQKSHWDTLMESWVGDIPMHRVLFPSSTMAFGADENPVLQHIRSAMHVYTGKMVDVMGEINYNYRRQVKASSPDTVPSVGMNPLLHKSSWQNYGLYASMLIEALVRSQQEHQLDFDGEPMFHLVKPVTEAQHTAIRKILGHTVVGDDLSHLAVLLHELLLALATPPVPEIISSKHDTECPIARFCILNSIRLDANLQHSYAHVRFVPPTLSKMIYFIRGTVLMEMGRDIWQTRPPLSTTAKEKLLYYTYDAAKHTPMSWLRQMKRLANVVLASCPTVPRLMTVGDNNDTVILDGLKITLETFRAMVLSLESKANDLLDQDVLRGLSLDGFDINDIHDDVNDHTLHYSFAKHPHNKDKFKAYRKQLIHQLTRGDDATLIQSQHGSTYYWDEREV